MKLTKYIMAFAAVAALTACEKDGDTIYTTGPDKPMVEGSESNIVLSVNNLKGLVLTLYWNDNGQLTTSDERVEAPDGAVTNTLQLSADEAFSAPVEEVMSQGVYSRQYTCSELNSILQRLDYVGDVEAPLYVRVKTSMGNNIDPIFSNVLTYNVVPFTVDMTKGLILDKNQEETGKYLWSPESNGIYTGFYGASGWENWWMREGNFTVWGNDGVDGLVFQMGNSTTGLDVWNFWYPEPAGCYYNVVNTLTNQWIPTYVPELNLSGDVNGAMTFERKSTTWTYTFNAAAAGTINVSISGMGHEYNTIGSDSQYSEVPVAFTGVASGLALASAPTAISVDVPAAGETTLTLDLTDPQNWTLTATSGGAAPVETVAPYAFLIGIDPGDWLFNHKIFLYDEDNKGYAAVHNINSEWGYKISMEDGSWDNVYTMVDGGTAYSGNLEFNGPNNIPAPEAGLYLVHASLGYMNYSVTPVTSVSYSGLNDDWNLHPMTATADPCVFTAEVEKTANTPWGVKILLNDGWDLFFGGVSNRPGELVYNHDGFEGDNDLANGTYILTVDLANATYSYTAK